MAIDLHIHTNFSDGETSPQGIVQMALRKGLSAIAITDHDTMEGIADAQQAAMGTDLEVVPGIELSTCWKGRAVHLLGYYFDTEDEEFHRQLEWVQEGRKLRNEQVLEKLIELGCEVSMEELLTIAGSGLVGRPHLAKLLIKKGYAGTMEEAFRRYLGAGAKAYVSRRSLMVADAVEMLHRARGVAVVAHPCTLGYSFQELAKEVMQMAALGIDGLEVFYPKHSKEFVKKLRKLAEEHTLITTGGSDYHSETRSGTGLAGGRHFVGDYVLEELKERHAHICAQQQKSSLE